MGEVPSHRFGIWIIPATRSVWLEPLTAPRTAATSKQQHKHRWHWFFFCFEQRMAFYRLEKTKKIPFCIGRCSALGFAMLFVRLFVCLLLLAFGLMVFATKFSELFSHSFRFAKREHHPKALSTRIVTNEILIIHLSNCMNLRGVRRHEIFHSFSFRRPKMSSDKL